MIINKIKYKIVVRAIQFNPSKNNNTILTFSVPNYDVIEGGFIRFLDIKTNKYKIFHASNVEIIEVDN